MTSGPNYNEDPDTTGSAVPPYEGRTEGSDVDSQEESTKDGAKVGGATGPVEDDEFKAPDPDQTPGGATGSPADEQPASESSDSDEPRGDELSDTGPGHTPGTGRAEDQS